MPKGPAHSKARAPYASQACTVCRSRKSKCDGVKPVCGYCTASGRYNECSWGKADKPPRRARTEANFEALRKRADSLQAYVDLLEGMLANCVCQDVSFHLQFRPHSPEEQNENEGENDPDSDEDIARELTAPMQLLKLDNRLGGLFLRGITTRSGFSNNQSNEVSWIPEAGDPPQGSYILQIDGVDVSESHPGIDWARHLPPDVGLGRKEHDKLLHLCFTFFTSWSFRLVPSLFLRDMYRVLSTPRSETPPTTLHYSPMLHNAILSLAANYSDDPIIRDSKTRCCFANAAKTCFPAESKKPNLSLLCALSLLATFYGDFGDRIQAELFVGMANSIRTALGLGLDATAWAKAGLITQEEVIARNWAHWSMLSLEITWALHFGLPFVGPRLSGRKMPIPFVDSEMDQILWSYPPANIPPQPNLMTTILFHSSALLVVSSQIIDVVNGLAHSPRLDIKQLENQIIKIDLDLYNWKSGLPLELEITSTNRAKSTPQRFWLHLAYWMAFIVLHRPFFNQQGRPQEGEVDHIKLCTHAAENILELLETYRSVYTLRMVPGTMVQLTFGAGTIFLLRALHATAGRRIAHSTLQTAVAQVEQCVTYLAEIGATWMGGLRWSKALQSILDDRLRPIIARRLAYREQTMASGVAPPVSSSSLEATDFSESSPFVPHWTQPLAPPDFAPVAFDTRDFCPMAVPDVDIAAFLPNIHYFDGDGLFGQALIGGGTTGRLTSSYLDEFRAAPFGTNSNY